MTHRPLRPTKRRFREPDSVKAALAIAVTLSTDRSRRAAEVRERVRPGKAVWA